MPRERPRPLERFDGHAAIAAPLTHQLSMIEEIMRENDVLMRILDVTEAFEHRVWIGAGVVFQNVWNAMYGLEQNTYIKDIDMLFFDPSSMDGASERSLLELLSDVDVGLELDAVNVARIHTWYERDFGIPIEPYASVAHSVATWPTIASCLAMSLHSSSLDWIAPYGVHDVFAGIIRPNKVMIPEHVFDAKASRWSKQWPELRVMPW